MIPQHSRPNPGFPRRVFTRLILACFWACFASAFNGGSLLAQQQITRVSSVQIDGTNVLVRTRAPAGARAAVLESRAGFASGSWQPRATAVLQGNASNLTFRLPRSQQMELFRVRMEGVTNRVPRMIVFGDSLSDTGNHFELDGTPAPPNYRGRYSDGPNWVDQLAARLHIGPDEWINYAVGSATSGREDAYDRLERPGMLDELDQFVADAPGLGAGATNSLFVIWVGANDFARWFFTGAFTNHTPQDLVGTLVNNVRHTIETLADRGARRFLVPNLPDLGVIPFITQFNNSAAIQAASLGTLGFNENLAWMLSDVKARRGATIEFVLYDVFSVFEAARANPSAFGLSNVVSGCWPNDTVAPCATPSSYLFWDDRHPTSAAHRILADGAALALVSGGKPLPEPRPVFPADAPTIAITTPHGQFTTASTAEVRGTTRGSVPAGATILVNGKSVTPSADGSFATVIDLKTNALSQPVVAELRAERNVLDRDRILIERGPGLRTGVITPDAVMATLNSNGVAAIRDAITAELAQSGLVDLNPFIPDVLDSDFSGTFQYAAVSLPAFYSCFTVDAQLSNGFVRLWFSLHDVAVNYHFEAWLHGLPDPGFECNGGFYAGNFSAYLDVAVRPAPGGPTGDVIVTAVSPLRWDIVNFQQLVHDCDLDDLLATFGFDLRQWFNGQVGNVQERIRNALNQYLGPGTGEMLASKLQRVISNVRLSKPLGDTLRVPVTGDVQQIAQRAGQVDVRFKAGFGDESIAGPETYGPPVGTIDHTGVDPVTQRPYDFAVSVSYRTLNQLLLAEFTRLGLAWETSRLDLGTGNLPVNAGLLSLLFPALRSEPAETPYRFVVRPTLPPMITGADSLACAGIGGAFDQVRIEIVRGTTGPGPVALAIAADLRGCVNLTYNQARSSVVTQLRLTPPDANQIAILENQINADEAVIYRLLRNALPLFLAELDQRRWELEIPSLRGLNLKSAWLTPREGHASIFLDLIPEIGRPDLAIAETEELTAIDPNFPFSLAVRVKNLGHAPAFGGTWVGASLSRDNVFLNGNDGELGLQYMAFNGGQLRSGESEWFTLQNLGPAPWATRTTQTLFVGVDVPPNFGGAGLHCESDELNNQTPFPIQLGSPDLIVVDIQVDNDTIKPFSSFNGGVLVRNIGHGPAFLPMQIGLGLSLDCTPNNGNDIPLGVFPVNFTTPLLPGDERWFPFSTLPTGNAVPGSQYLIAGVDFGFAIPEENELNNVRCEPVQVLGPDLAMHSMRTLDPVVQNHAFRVQFVITNRGASEVASPFQVCFGLSIDSTPNNGNDIPLGAFNVADVIPPNGSRTYTFVSAPIGNATTGGQHLLAGVDCGFNVLESNEGNNLGSLDVTVEMPRWDLKLEFVSVPSSAVINPCTMDPRTVSWRLRVTNVGNSPSPLFNQSPCLLQTAICADRASTDWDQPVDGIRYFPIPSLGYGQSTEFLVTDYRILCLAFDQIQYVKALIPCDGLSDGANFVRSNIDLNRR